MNSNFYACPEIGLDVENTRGTADVVGANLIRNCFFKLEISFPKKCWPIVCLLLFCRLICHAIEMIFSMQFSIK